MADKPEKDENAEPGICVCCGNAYTVPDGYDQPESGLCWACEMEGLRMEIQRLEPLADAKNDLRAELARVDAENKDLRSEGARIDAENQRTMNEKNEAVRILRLALPLVKGYAAEHRLAANRDIALEVERYLTLVDIAAIATEKLAPEKEDEKEDDKKDENKG